MCLFTLDQAFLEDFKRLFSVLHSATDNAAVTRFHAGLLELLAVYKKAQGVVYEVADGAFFVPPYSEQTIIRAYTTETTVQSFVYGDDVSDEEEQSFAFVCGGSNVESPRGVDGPM